MNYAIFADFIRSVEDDLVSRFGVSRDGAKRIATRLEIDAVNDYNETKDQAQLIIEYREHGPVKLSEITGLSRETLRKKYNEACAKKCPSDVAA